MTTTHDNSQSKGAVHWLDVAAKFEQMKTLLDLILDEDHHLIDHTSRACVMLHIVSHFLDEAKEMVEDLEQQYGQPPAT